MSYWFACLYETETHIGELGVASDNLDSDHVPHNSIVVRSVACIYEPRAKSPLYRTLLAVTRFPETRYTLFLAPLRD